jgi:hypothetical protein
MIIFLNIINRIENETGEYLIIIIIIIISVFKGSTLSLRLLLL